ncbi:protein translocase subunit SecF [Treponema sp. Marseille-Q3903]|uniref:protein translocase subunit SecF n=1 Tax=Treponema sp. Marseille-Q3903 TaxID=2766703 RepID=UPI0016529F87|nr:protein translocase subunit SecF [Treponema sp. Marseille-Q3903]MBC6713206.1 protein translocase subunit SecF [Treponema sp. Marseille-Q3903]
MKRFNFNKGFLPCTIISAVLICFGLVGLFTKGINFGLDFKPGLIEEVRVAEPVAEIVYSGPAKVTMDLSAGQMDIVVSGTGAENKTYSFNFAVLKTVHELAVEVNKIENVKMTERNSSYDSTKLFLNSAVTNQLTNAVTFIYPAGTSEITTDDIRSALDDKGVDIKQLGSGADASYQIRMGVKEGDAQNEIQTAVNEKLFSKFGKENVAIVKTDFIGSGMSKTTTIRSIIMFVLVVVLIWAYAAIRFHWDFALGSVIALVHDSLIMIAFITWTQMEFTSTVLAAVLTIVGYSINATVVILDRVRYNMKMMPEVAKFDEILNQSLSDTLVRSILTTVTTLFAVVALFIFTTGTIKDFSLAMIVGLLSGMYSSIFISSAFISLSRRNWKPEFGVHHSLKSEKAE